jgi:hypothetical protein
MRQGSLEFEGSLVKLHGGRFSAHVRKADGRGTMGRRLPPPYVKLRHSFVGLRFASCLKDWMDMSFDVVIDSVQKSSAQGFDYFVSGRVFDKEVLRKKSPKDPRLDASRRIWI